MLLSVSPPRMAMIPEPSRLDVDLGGRLVQSVQHRDQECDEMSGGFRRIHLWLVMRELFAYSRHEASRKRAKSDEVGMPLWGTGDISNDHIITVLNNLSHKSIDSLD